MRGHSADVHGLTLLLRGVVCVIRRAVSVEHLLVTDRHTDRQTDRTTLIPALASVARVTTVRPGNDVIEPAALSWVDLAANNSIAVSK